MASTDARLIVNAIGVHQGGGLAILRAVLAAMRDFTPALVMADSRCPLGRLPENVEVRRFAPGAIGRIKAELWLARQSRPTDVVLCLNNVPPLLPIAGAVTVFLQNKQIVDTRLPPGLPVKGQLRLIILRRLLRHRSDSVGRIVVQTPGMRTAVLQAGIAASAAIDVCPFADLPADAAAPLRSRAEPASVFVYVATGDRHKNHANLLHAWELLAQDGVRPTLHLTVGAEAPELARQIAEFAAARQLDIRNHGHLSVKQVAALYEASDSLVFPSFGESFGLPLLEARRFGLRILAPELDYVRDVVIPDETFDPHSPTSIARAVLRAMGRPSQPVTVVSARQLLDLAVSPPRKRAARTL